MPQTKGSAVAVTFLGGLGEIGRNCAVLETNGRRVLLDCGRMFAGKDLPGVDSVLPSFDWLLERGEPNSGVEACVVTHAHEDHIGALPYLLEHLKFPIYGSPFTLALVRHKLTEAGLIDRVSLHPVNDGDRFTAGPFECEALPVTHSIPGGLITAFDTPQGIILHSSDFKLDHTPVDGRRTGLARIGAIAHNPGVAVAAGGLHQRRHAGQHRLRKRDRPGASTGARRAAGPQGDNRLVRQPRSPHPTNRRRRGGHRTGGGHFGPVDEPQRHPGPSNGLAAHRRRVASRHQGHGKASNPAVS